MEFEEHHEEVVNICPEQNVTEEMDKPFLDVAQFFLDDDENDKVEELGEEEEEEEEQEGSRKPYKTFTAVQLQEAQLLDSSKTFVPIPQELDDSFVSHIDTEIIPLPDIVGANPLMFLNEEEELYPNVGRDFLSVIPEGFQGDDLLLAGEGDLFMDETNFFNFSRELEERERDTPSPANDDTEKEDEGEGEEHIKMEDKARTISPLQLHAPSAATKVEFPNKDEIALLNKAAAGLEATTEVPSSPTKSRKRSLACISGSKADQKRTKRKRKTPEQLAVLEREFDANPMPNKEVRDQLSSRLGLTSRQVQIWFQNKRAKVKNNSNSSSGSNGSTPYQSPSTSRSSSPLLMLAPQQQAQQKGQPRLVPANFAPENFAALAAAHPHPIPLAPNAFFDILSGRSVNQFLASLAALTPHQQQALADLPAILANNAHIVPTPIAPAPTHTPIAPAPTPAHAPIPILPASPDIQKASVNKPVTTAV